MGKMKGKQFSWAVLIPLLFSCQQRGPALYANHYDAYLSFAHDLEHLRSDFKGDLIANFEENDHFRESRFSYYLSGLCSGHAIHKNHEEICPTLDVNAARSYVITTSYRVCVSWNLSSKPWSAPGSLRLSSISNYQIVSPAFSRFLPDYNDPFDSDCAGFGFDSNDYARFERDYFRALVDTEMKVYAYVVYSKGIANEEIEAVNNALLAPIESI